MMLAGILGHCFFFFFSSRRRHTRYWRDWSSDVCSSDLNSMMKTDGFGRRKRLLSKLKFKIPEIDLFIYLFTESG